MDKLKEAGAEVETHVAHVATVEETLVAEKVAHAATQEEVEVARRETVESKVTRCIPSSPPPHNPARYHLPHTWPRKSLFS